MQALYGGRRQEVVSLWHIRFTSPSTCGSAKFDINFNYEGILADLIIISCKQTLQSSKLQLLAIQDNVLHTTFLSVTEQEVATNTILKRTHRVKGLLLVYDCISAYTHVLYSQLSYIHIILHQLCTPLQSSHNYTQCIYTRIIMKCIGQCIVRETTCRLYVMEGKKNLNTFL